MSTISLTLPADGDTIDAEDVNNPFNTIANAINGNLDSTNISSLNGTKINAGTLPATAFDNSSASGWVPTGESWNYASNNGAKEFTFTVSTDKTTKYATGMKLKYNRSATPPTQSMSFTRGSSQYASKASPAGIAFSTAFTAEAWIYITGYTATTEQILTQLDAGGNNGWVFEIDNTGRLGLRYFSAGVSTTFRAYQSVPLNRWVHVAGAVTSVSGKTGQIYINGQAIPSEMTGTATALTQAGDLMIGNLTGGTDYFNGQMSEVRLWTIAQSQSSIQANMAISLVGTEPNLIGLWQGNGDFNDKSSNANNLTAQGGAVATYLANPYSTTEYGVVTKVSYSSPNTTITVFTGTDYMVPSNGVTNIYFSVARAPFGFPADRLKWRQETIINTQYLQSSPAANTWYNVGSWQIALPVGSWRVSYNATIYGTRASGNDDVRLTLSSANNNEESRAYTTVIGASPITDLNSSLTIDTSKTVTSQTTYYLNLATAASGMNGVYLRGDTGVCSVFAESTYI